MMRTKLAALFCAGALVFLDAAPAFADDWQPIGLIRSRDMTPFGLPRLDFLPAHAIAPVDGTYGIELNLSYQNTWARSENVEDYLASRGTGRAPLTEADVAAILALPGDAYLVDGEYGLVDLSVHVPLGRRWEAYATLPFFFFDGGFMDSSIEGFHDVFGFGDAGREFVPRNQWQAIAKIGPLVTMRQTAPGNNFGDPVVGLRYAVNEHGNDWNLIVETAVKVPRSSKEKFLISTGAADYGLQVSFQKFFARNAFYATLSGVYFSSTDPALADDQLIPTAVLGWETRLSRNTNFILQLYASRSVVQETTLDELSDDKLQITAGVQGVYGGNILRFGLTENLSNFNNTPDVGLTLSYGRIFGGE